MLRAADIARQVAAGELAPDEVAATYVARTKAHAAQLNTHLHFDADAIKSQVEALAKRVKAKEALPLAGVPVLVKDNIATRGMPTTCASKILAGYVPPYDAHVVERLRAAGAIIFGKTNCDEFAMGSSNENSAYGPVKNPWDLTRVPGGSSGGSAAAVAASLAPLALGSDTGGSIRQPAALCGIFGLKPTYGRVSRYGLVAYGSSLDAIGPFARNVEDLALLTDVISGHDARDATSAARPPTQYQAGLAARGGAKGIKIGLVKEFFAEGLDAATREHVMAAVKVLEGLGTQVVEVSLPSLVYSTPAYYMIATAEASSNLARYDGVRYGARVQEPGQSLKQMYRRTRSKGFGREVKQRIMLGTFALSSGYYDAYYAKAGRAREVIRRELADVFTKVDLLVSPTSPTTAFKLGEKTQDPLAMYLSDICTLAANLAGIPALSVPCGFDHLGLPIGMQFMAREWGEETLLKGAYAYEQASKWHDAQPRL